MDWHILLTAMGIIGASVAALRGNRHLSDTEQQQIVSRAIYRQGRNGLIFLACLVGGVVLFANLKWQADARKARPIVKKYGLSKTEADGLSVCLSDTASMKLVIGGEIHDIGLPKVQEQLCLCHMKTIVRIFKPGHFSQHYNIAHNVGKGLPLHPIHKPSIADEHMAGDVAAFEVAASLNECAKSVVADLRQSSLSHP